MNTTLASTLRRAASTMTKKSGDISSVFPSLSGKQPEPLPARFSQLKKTVAKGNEDALRASWSRLLIDLKEEVEDIKTNGTNVIPTVQYEDIARGTVSDSFIRSVRHRGVGVVRNVLPRQQALDLKHSAQDYIASNRSKVTAFPPDNPAVYELYWSPSQVAARTHSNMLQTQSFLSAALWHSSDSSSQISITYPISYADRLRIRQPGDAKFALGPHTDGGSLERWEDREYRSVYRKILSGDWEAYDPFDARHRIDARMDLYSGAGSCSMFRLFQGWLAMSSTGPGEGTLKVCPLLRHATAYLLLRPFFDPKTNELDLESTSFPGATPGGGQEYNPLTHPHLCLEDTMVSVPKVEPGDYVAWHCDAIHSVDSQHTGKGDSSVMYIPACAITEQNINSLLRQRDNAEKWSPPPDFPGAGGEGESTYEGKVDWTSDAISAEGKRAMGLNGGLRWKVTDSMSLGEKRAIESANKLLFGA